MRATDGSGRHGRPRHAHGPRSEAPAEAVAATIPAQGAAAGSESLAALPAGAGSAEPPTEPLSVVPAPPRARHASTPLVRDRRGLRGGLRKPVLVGAAALSCLLLVGAGTTAAMVKNVTIVVDGQSRQVTTLAGTVDGALSSAGLIVGDHDTLAPSAASGIADGATIVLDRGRLLQLTVDGTERDVWTTAKTVDEALDELGLSRSGELQLSANRSRAIPLGGLEVSAVSTHRVNIAIAGGAAEQTVTSSRTVRALLAEQGIALGPLDVVSPAPGTTLVEGATITVTRIGRTTVTERHELPQPADQRVNDADLEQGATKVAQKGAPGVETVTIQVKLVNGAEAARTETGRTVTLAAKPNVIKVGTKPVDPAGEVAAAKAEKGFTYRGSQVFTNDHTFGVNWDGLAFCESTHNPKAVNANPSAGLPTYGMFQFDIPTWESVGGSGNPMDASPSEQLMRAKKLYQSRGLEPWACRDSAH